jgi:hypothetical protein
MHIHTGCAHIGIKYRLIIEIDYRALRVQELARLFPTEIAADGSKAKLRK